MLLKVRFIAVTSAVLVLACGSDDLGSFGKPGGGGGGDAPWSTTTATGSGGAGGATQTSSAGGTGGVGATGGTGGVGGTAHSTGGFGGTGGSGGQGAAGGSGGVGGIGGTGGQGGASSSSTTSTTASCKVGGDACQGFAECCSGQCAGGVCTPCASEGQSCGDPGGCCNTLACYKGACVSCSLDGDSCQASSDCCSNICSNGSCVSCKDLGAACSYDQQCCGSNVCTAGACACPASKHECNGVCEPNTPETGCLGSASCAPCATPANAVAVCTAQGACDFTCNPKYAKSGSTCVFIGDGVCVPNATESCYNGPPGTEGVGACRAGTRTCNAAGSAWGGCIGRVLPKTEVCANGIDDDCNGVVDDGGLDLDGDGWSKCEGDCCDSLADGCAAPALVNPGAFDVDGNGFDDDCDGAVDNGAWTCDAGLVSSSSTALDYAKAIDLCKSTVDSPPKAQRTWGVISSGLFLANGAGTPAANSRSIRSGFGTKVTPRRGAKLAVFSTGHAAAKGDVNPSYVAFQTGQDMKTSSGAPGDWLAANGGKFPSSPGCPATSSTEANDPVMLKLRVRVPTNARSFSLSSFFYSAEYPEWTCSSFNDFFLALLDSSFTPGMGESSNPLDKNLAFVEGVGGLRYPVGVGLAVDSLGLFSACMNGTIGCNGTSSSYTKCSSVDELAGTGFDDVATGCGENNLLGGGTGWLTTTGNVRPGETMELRLVIWDTGDHVYDSLSLVDGFEWSSLSAEPGTRQ